MKKVIDGPALRSRLEAKPAGELFHIVPIFGQLIERTVVDDAQPAFNQTQEVIAGAQDLVIGYRHQVAAVQGFKCLPGIADAEQRHALAVLQLEKLYEEFDINDAAEAPLQIPFAAAGFQALAHAPDFSGPLRPPGLAVYSIGNRGHHFVAKVGVPVYDPGPRERLPLPELGGSFLIVTAELS